MPHMLLFVVKPMPGNCHPSVLSSTHEHAITNAATQVCRGKRMKAMYSCAQVGPVNVVCHSSCLVQICACQNGSELVMGWVRRVQAAHASSQS